MEREILGHFWILLIGGIEPLFSFSKKKGLKIGSICNFLVGINRIMDSNIDMVMRIQGITVFDTRFPDLVFWNS